MDNFDFRPFGGIPANTSSNNSNEYDINLVIPGTADDRVIHSAVIAEFQKLY